MKTSHSIQTIFQDLLKTIQQNDEVDNVSKQFSKIITNRERVEFVSELLKKYEVSCEFVKDKKCDKVSVNLREQGNQKFKGKLLQEALELYTQSLANAEENSENFSKALANRSAVLFELELYEECLKDIEKSLENNYPKDLQPKLIKRKNNALSQVQSEKGRTLYFKPAPDLPTASKSPSIACATNLLEIQSTPTQGRHVVAKENIEIGDILAVEKPFCHILASEFYSHCHECLRLSYNLLPCSNCTQVFYCSSKCQKEAQKYHKYECNILKTLRSLQLDKMKLLPLKLAILTRDYYNEIKTYNGLDSVDKNNKYRSDRYKEIHNLVANTRSRSVADLFERSTTAAVIFNLVKTHTQFFCGDTEEEIFKEILLLHFQTAPCNFHEISELSRTNDGYFETQEIGAGAFSFLSLFNHCCNPNVVRHCHGNTVVLRAIRSIAKGEQCYDNYGYHYALMLKPDRQLNLNKQYFFECNCEVCIKDWPTLPFLSSPNFKTGVTDSDIMNLRKGNEACIDQICQKLLPKIKELEKSQPSRMFAEMQEVLKQCYALLGNVRRT
ncbi:unnamed protein product [Diabrotica balteata]|uniref:Protein-lysine N-methyltransferase SMYD4 n=1 Tax=Diabrotica balteata TaxID=107213 RepID=A0A9N9SYJ9_DIABA|nr:unnamed protein product [Diabrotica balteata]